MVTFILLCTDLLPSLKLEPVQGQLVSVCLTCADGHVGFQQVTGLVFPLWQSLSALHHFIKAVYFILILK